MVVSGSSGFIWCILSNLPGFSMEREVCFLTFLKHEFIEAMIIKS